MWRVIIISIFQKFFEKPEKASKTDSVENTSLSDDIKLSTIEIFFLGYLNGFETTSDFPQYWRTEYNINAKAMLKKMLDSNYIRLATVQENLQYYTVAELKEVLKANALKSSGKKDILILNLQQSLSTEELEHYFKRTTYILTEKGMPYMEQFDFLWFFHKNMVMELSINDAQALKDKHPDWDKFQIALHILNNRLPFLEKDKDWDLYRKVLFDISEVYEAATNYEKQLEYLCLVCYRDLSGMSNNDTVMPKSNIILAPGVIGRLRQAQEKLQFSDKDLENFYLNVVNNLNLPHTYYSPKSSWNKVKKEL